MARNFGRPIQQIILHTTATSQSATVESIKTFWATPKRNKVTGEKEPYIPNLQGGCGWSTPIGYHYIIGVNGERHILAHLSQVVNGVRGYNWNSCHISYIGGRNGDDRTPAQKAETKKLIQELRSDKILGPIPVIGHRDTYGDANRDGVIDSRDWKKTCPSFSVSDWLVEDGVI
jgi:hypothetical protein